MFDIKICDIIFPLIYSKETVALLFWFPVFFTYRPRISYKKFEFGFKFVEIFKLKRFSPGSDSPRERKNFLARRLLKHGSFGPWVVWFYMQTVMKRRPL